MRGQLARRRWSASALVVALAVGAGLVGATSAAADLEFDPEESTPLSVPGMPVSLAQSGEVALWGDDTFGQSTVPAELTGVAVSQVALAHQAGLAVTAAGKVVGWGSHVERLERVPAEVAAAKVAQIAVSNLYAGAVTRDGRVMTWGPPRAVADPLDIPPGLSGVKQLALTSTFAAAALKHDGSVVAWGLSQYGETAVPEQLKTPGSTAAIAASAGTFYALTAQGTVVTWGGALVPGLPASVQQPGNVKAISASFSGALALLDDDTLVVLGSYGELPAEVAAVDPVLLANAMGQGSEFAIVDRDRAIHYWRDPGSGPMVVEPVAPELHGRDLVQIVQSGLSGPTGEAEPTGGAIVRKMLRAELPRVSGSVRVGSVLTGVPGTFSAEPESVTGQWLVGGTPAGGGAQLTVTAAMAGKTIAYRSTATKTGETSVSSTSANVVVPRPPAPKVASSTKVVKVKVAKKGAKVDVTGKVSASRPSTGRAVITIAKGKKTIVAKTVAVSSAGAVKLSVKKFSTLVAKKLKAKGKKAKTAYRGKYTVRIAYAGNAQVKPSATAASFKAK